MRRSTTAGLVTSALVVGIVASPARGQDPPEHIRVFCDSANPRNHCPGPDCLCLDDTLEVTFDGESDSVLQYEKFEGGTTVRTVIVTETRTPDIQGFSFAVEHDSAFLALNDVAPEEALRHGALTNGFVMLNRFGIQACPRRHRKCRDPQPGAGYICGVVLDMTGFATLPVQRNRHCSATYGLVADSGRNGTLVQIVSGRLQREGGLPVPIVLTVGGKSRSPATVVDGWVKGAGEATFEVCDNWIDDDGDGSIDCEDSECVDSPACGREDCTNNVDDDGDGLADCDDRECSREPECQPRPEICGNSRDDDRDGATDCMDTDCCGEDSCWNSPVCPPRPEACANGRDDDRDGHTDCDDTDCCDEPLCEFSLICPPRPEVCGNFHDDDRDGLLDCDDPDCAADENCLPGPERKRLYCDPTDPENQCPGDKCRCAPATLEVTFDGKADSIFQLDAFQAGGRVETTIVSDVGARRFWGWSYAVEHDPGFLTLESVTVAGTDAELGLRGGFVALKGDGLVACSPDDLKCEHGVPGSGYICAVILSFGAPWELAAKRNTLCRADYSMQADPGADGTIISFVDNRLKVPGSPPMAINFTVEGRSKCPTWLVDGWVKVAGDAAGEPAASRARFLRGDADGSGKVNVVDVIALLRVLFERARPRFACDRVLDASGDGRVDVGDVVHLLRYVFSRGPDLPAPFPQCGVEAGAGQDALACGESNCSRE